MTDVVQEISDWLIHRGLGTYDFEHVIGGFCEQLRASGMPLARAMVAMRTLHPAIDAHSFIWRPGAELSVTDFGMDANPSAMFLASPLNHLLNHRDLYELRRPLTGPDAVVDFEILAELRDRGFTDYFIQKVPFTVTSGGRRPTGMLCSWTSDSPDGFGDRDLAVLRRLALRLGLSVSNILQREITLNVLDTYVGRDAGARILSGEIRRGSLREIDAVILYMDLRGFTALADRNEGAVMAGLLNDYFERIVPEIVDRGGEVLKYMGDGILATFNLEGRDEAATCSVGLDAAIAALRGVESWNAEREAAGEETMALDVAVHLGRVLYGNVGAANRLDFTVIGAAVNEASRLETLCDDLDRHLVISGTFAAAATRCTARLVSLGRHALRGVRDEQEVFTVDYRGAAA